MIDKGLFGSTEVAEIIYENIEAITHSTGIMAGGLRITGLGSASFRIEMVIPKTAAKLFADCVRDQMRQQQGSANEAVNIATETVASPGDELLGFLGVASEHPCFPLPWPGPFPAVPPYRTLVFYRQPRAQLSASASPGACSSTSHRCTSHQFQHRLRERLHLRPRPSVSGGTYASRS